MTASSVLRQATEHVSICVNHRVIQTELFMYASVWQYIHAITQTLVVTLTEAMNLPLGSVVQFTVHLKRILVL